MVEQMPQFPGGQAEMMQFISKNMKYPTIAQENGTQGRVTCQFVVGADGKVRDVKVLRGVDPYLDKEAVRVIMSMPKWIPGKQNGKAVSVKYTIPVCLDYNKCVCYENGETTSAFRLAGAADSAVCLPKQAQGRTNGYVYLRCDCNCCGRKFPAYCAGRN